MEPIDLTSSKPRVWPNVHIRMKTARYYTSGERLMPGKTYSVTQDWAEEALRRNWADADGEWFAIEDMPPPDVPASQEIAEVVSPVSLEEQVKTILSTLPVNVTVHFTATVEFPKPTQGFWARLYYRLFLS